VVPRGGRPGGAPPAPRLRLPETPIPTPELAAGDTWNGYMMGIGGTGVVTINQVLGTAAVLEGKYVAGLDQTGLSQKGGPVVAHLKIAAAPLSGSSKIAAGQADCFLAFDMLTATTAQNLTRARAGRTVAVVSTSQVPTGGMVAAPGVRFPPADALVGSITARTRAAANVFIDAQALALRAFGDHMAANMIVLGAACQAGALPVRAESIERAIALNGVAVRMNTDAFRLGRRLPRYHEPNVTGSQATAARMNRVSGLLMKCFAPGPSRSACTGDVPSVIRRPAQWARTADRGGRRYAERGGPRSARPRARRA